MKTASWMVCVLFLGGCGSPSSDDGGTDMTASSDLSGASDLSKAADLTTPPDLTAGCGNVLLGGPQLPNVSAACKACGVQSCCDKLQACAADPECVAIRACYANCAFDDSTCSTACQTQHMSGVTSASAVSVCRNTNCAAECANTACQGAVVWPAPAKQTYSFTVMVIDYQSGAALAGATVKVCALADAACANPTQTATTDAKGSAQLTAPSAPGTLAAYIEMSAPNYSTTLLYLYRPLDMPLDGGSTSPSLLSTSLFGTFASIVLGKAPDPTRGTLVFEVDQCVSSGLAGASVAVSTADANSKTGYIAGGLPSGAATMTDSSGSGGVFNLPPGMATVVTTFNGKKYGSVQVQIRAGAVTSLNLLPTP